MLRIDSTKILLEIENYLLLSMLKSVVLLNFFVKSVIWFLVNGNFKRTVCF